VTTLDYQLVPFKRWHVGWLVQAGVSEGGFLQPDQEVLRLLEKLPNSWTMTLGADPLVCGGTIEMWPGRHQAWAYLNKNTGRHMGAVTKRALDVLGSVDGRIEFTVRKDFEPGHRWAKIMGFSVESPLMKGYDPDGSDHVGYFRLNR